MLRFFDGYALFMQKSKLPAVGYRCFERQIQVFQPSDINACREEH